MYATILSAAGRILLSLVMPLLTEVVIKRLLIIGLEKLAKRTEDSTDDKLVEEVKKAWGVE